MSVMEGKDLETLKREFQEKKAEVWANESLPWQEQQARIGLLWEEFDRRRNELLERSVPTAEATGEGGVFQHPVFSKRRRRGHVSF